MTTDTTITVHGRRYTLTPHKTGWRIRSRALGNEIDLTFPERSLAQAKRDATAHFAAELVVPKRNASTLEDLVTCYKGMPKRAGDAASTVNIYRLRGIVRTVHKRELDRVPVSAVGPDLWSRYMASKLGGKLDLSRRRAGNEAINSAVRCAASLFIPKLRPNYKSAGIEVPDDATVIQWLPRMVLPRPAADDAALLKALPTASPIVRLTASLARFAGLRQDEIANAMRSWVVVKDGAVSIELRDRPEQDWTSKTGQMYRALVIDSAFADELVAMPHGYLIETPNGMTRSHWFKHYPQRWISKFTGTAGKPLHRLRGLYADAVASLTQDAIAARLAGVKAASSNLGHTNTQTTQRSYLS
ncbi:hypothetical protein UFOVP1329_1 [uncultured Caudovirales phage]|uniref:Uncharacterized protein n=1 Tax=uncultured Caudovirales phage TaxID=2100421 RepID=A0A6J5S1E2_9CAUD|nr:hypothetical protein UFOVP1150_26 [uncultured Caudovirales phage]CAB4198865.1 hypothetical protein UFOVP1329_1 [uncultured Caudovirales phage]CAB4218739.1 hypothetical protein UFOVP1595_35 [uncultured Caudovirales phage]